MHWTQAVTAADAFAQAHPALVHEIGYRDLHSHPDVEIERLFRFLGASTERSLMARIAAETSFEAMAGRPAGVEDLSSFLRHGSSGNWKARLDEEGVELISEHCGELMRRKRFA
jgi:hypothetical protein